MADVIDFPSKANAPADDGRTAREIHELQCDFEYVAETLKTNLPPEAQRHITSLQLKSIATQVVLAINAARYGRLLDPEYDEHRRAGVIRAFSHMIRGNESDDAPAPPEPPDCA